MLIGITRKVIVFYLSVPCNIDANFMHARTEEMRACTGDVHARSESERIYARSDEVFMQGRNACTHW